ncbi:uncharacterized protein LOC120837307 [Ixodes scapularis]|uniref:uncharacterized protein LOC120837307 n=1 Tax=Ixodes scapularis TaxID=6945 RepID=UPI001A9DBD10|nr:uncharacterized protein LOC120837307 [Ixodes scapularis]
MIMANFVLVMTCLQIIIIGAASQQIEILRHISTTEIAQKCQTVVHKKCEREAKGNLTKIGLDLPSCRLYCYSKLSDGKLRVTLTWLPDYMPCLIGNICKNGECIFDERIQL